MKKRHINRLKLEHISEAIAKRELFNSPLLGQRIKSAREALGMSQAQLAKRISVTQQAVTKIENHAGTASIKTLEKILSALGIELMFALTSAETLEQKLYNRALEKARSLVKRAHANMAMERQHPGEKKYEEQVKKLADEIAANPDYSLWEDL
jgi:predicted DNA-binding mobile mystery protein A